MNNLWDFYFNAYDSALEMPWRLYDSKTHKLLCEDYQKLPDTEENKWFDFLRVVSHVMVMTKSGKRYLKVYVRAE